MIKPLFIRIAGALGITSLAIFFISLIPFLGAAPTAGAAIKVPAFTVNRELKGDRLPIPTTRDTASGRAPREQRLDQGAGEIPIGCDPAFSPVTNPQLARYYGRCAT